MAPFLIFLILLLSSCGGLPAIKKPAYLSGEQHSDCPSPFLKKPLRLIHAIEMKMGKEPRGAVIGVTLADPATRFISCAILTAEGVVLFEAQAAPSLKVFRALPPFDSLDFAQNMIDDIKLIFFAPGGKMLAGGTLEDGTEICRYRDEGGNWIDVRAGIAEKIEINKYSSTGILKRQIKLDRTKGNIYQHIELTAQERFNYALTMTLLEMEPVESELLKEDAEGDVK